MFGRLFGKRELVAPVSGTCVALAEVEDPAFAEGMVGPGVAVRPCSDTVVAPCDGTVALLPETMHAFVIEGEHGAQVLVHVGVDTVELKGEGFRVLASRGERVRAGQPVVAFDEAMMSEKGMDMTVIVVLLEMDGSRVRPAASGKSVVAGTDVICTYR